MGFLSALLPHVFRVPTFGEPSFLLGTISAHCLGLSLCVVCPDALGSRLMSFEHVYSQMENEMATSMDYSCVDVKTAAPNLQGLFCASKR